MRVGSYNLSDIIEVVASARLQVSRAAICVPIGRKQLDRGREGHLKAYLAFTLLLLQEESYLNDFRSARLLPISISCLWQWKASIGISGHREEE